jgi:hypothetical protein
LAKRRSPARIIQDYVDYLNDLVNQTVSHGRLSALEKSGNPRRLIGRYVGGRIKPLALKPRGFFHVEQLVEPTADSRVSVLYAKYKYSFSDNPDDRRADIFRYEYDKFQSEPLRPRSHLHVNAKHERYAGMDFARVHFPTGRVSLEQVVAALILEFGVQTLGDQMDAVEFLRASHAGWIVRRTDLKEAGFP